MTVSISTTDGSRTVSVVLANGYSTQQTPGNIVHNIIGGPPVVTLRPAQPRQGTLNLLFEDEQTAEAARALLVTPALFVYRDTDLPTVGMTFALDGQGVGPALENETRQWWTVSVGYLEVTA
ncbi:hypothetical protein GCM10027414_07180 [Humibacter ginsengiterrae]